MAPDDTHDPEGASDSKATPRAGRCAIVGRPNVGKSTLMNRLLGQKLAIATSRPGTTRSSVLGVYASDEPPTQIAFVDTPGLHRPKSALGKVLLEQAQLGLVDADVVVFLVEAPGPKGRVEVEAADRAVLAMLAEVKAPVLLAINKVDLLKDKSRLLPLIKAFQEVRAFAAVVPVSAVRGVNLPELIAEIRQRLPEGLMYEPDFLTDRPERFFVAELIREAVMNRTRQEVPHGTACVLDSYVEDGNLLRIDATIVVEKESHKGIVIGARGSLLKEIGTDARVAIEELVGRKVFLKLWVKVIPGWTGNPLHARRLATEVEQS